MGWTYEVLERDDMDPDSLMCKCGHSGEDHHAVYWPRGISLDECEAYGSNETGGMKQTWTGWFFYHILPPNSPSKQRLRDFARRIPGLRGPWYADHCHKFEVNV